MEEVESTFLPGECFEINVSPGVKLMEKVYRLLLDPLSKEMTQRHVQILEKYLELSSDGIPLREVPPVLCIMDILAERMHLHEAYRDILVQYLNHFRKPLCLNKNSEFSLFQYALRDLISFIGYFLISEHYSIHNASYETLLKMLKFSPTVVKVHETGLKPMQLPPMIEALESSELPSTLLSVMSFTEFCPVVHQILKLMRIVVSRSKIIAYKLLQEGAVELLLMQLSDPRSILLEPSIHILFDVLTSCNSLSREDAARLTPSCRAVSTLAFSFMHFLRSECKEVDVELRNDLATIILRLVQLFPELPFIHVGLAQELSNLFGGNLLYAYSSSYMLPPDAGKRIPVNKPRPRPKPTNQNLEFIAIVLNILDGLSHMGSIGIKVWQDNAVMASLLKLVTEQGKDLKGSNNLHYLYLDWSASQRTYLRNLGMQVLVSIIPVVPHEYLLHNGTQSLVSIMSRFSETETERQLLWPCVEALYAAASTENMDMLQHLADNGAIPAVMRLMDHTLKLDVLENADMKLLYMGFLLLSSLGAKDFRLKEAFGSVGVDLLVRQLRRLVNPPPQETLLWAKLATCVCECAWTCLVGCPANRNRFLSLEGLFLLLDVLEKSSTPPVQVAVLGCLCDVLGDSPTALGQLLIWRGVKCPPDGGDGKGGERLLQGSEQKQCPTTLPALMCKLWREEEKRLGVARDAQGCIADTSCPLVGNLQSFLKNCTPSATEPSASLLVLPGTLRPKIYALYHIMSGCTAVPLDDVDRVTGVLIDHYLELKAGEVLEEVRNELERENVSPITPDMDMLEGVTLFNAKRVQGVLEIQGKLLEQFMQRELQEESCMYKKTQRCLIPSALEAMREVDFVARTSCHPILEQYRALQKKELEESAIPIFGSNHLNTVEHHLDVTTFCQRHLVLDRNSNIQEIISKGRKKQTDFS